MARNRLEQPDVPGKDGGAARSSGTRGETARGARKRVSQGPRETPAVPHQLWMEGLKYCSFHRVKPGSILSYSVISEVGQTPQKHSTKPMKPAFFSWPCSWQGRRRGGRLGGEGVDPVAQVCGAPQDSASHRNPVHTPCRPEPCLPGAACWGTELRDRVKRLWLQLGL